MDRIKAGWSGTVSINGKVARVFRCNSCRPYEACCKDFYSNASILSRHLFFAHFSV